jgi:deoxyribodipyrimidine photolyase-related protein
MTGTPTTGTLWVVLGDQLDVAHPLFSAADPQQDTVWMAEVADESTKVWSHKARIAMFLSAMRHFAQQVTQHGLPLHYTPLDGPDNQGTLARQLQFDCTRLQPKRIVMVQAGEWHVGQAIQDVADTLACPLTLLPDTHFLCSAAQFAQHASQRKQLRMKFFYRSMRQTHGVLLTADHKPVGGQWNFDHDNQGAFPKQGPGTIDPPRAFLPDAITQAVLTEVDTRFADHPGSLAHFDWPVTPADAALALTDFIDHRLPQFGQYQDAMWIDPLQPQAYLYHSRLSAALNLKLLHPLTVIQAAEAAYNAKQAPLPAVEGFIRQILGWREYVRGVYWQFMPAYQQRNALSATAPLPAFYWTGDTEMACLRSVIQQTLQYGYAHHIQRLMVTGLFALLLGVDPVHVHQWYLAMYVDAVEWVELPNTLGMSQYADGGVMASKPYIASGQYINRMSNACKHCVYKPDQRLGAAACPFTTLYWDFLHRHEADLAKNPRMGLQVKNMQRLAPEARQAIATQAAALRQQFETT